MSVCGVPLLVEGSTFIFTKRVFSSLQKSNIFRNQWQQNMLMNKRYLLCIPILCCLSSCEVLYNPYGGGITGTGTILLIVLAFLLLYRITRTTSAPSKEDIHAHLYVHLEDYQLASREFYGMVERTLTDKAFPEVDADTITLSEGSVWTPNREYLQVRCGDLTFIICAAPFGKNFFISWWLKEKRYSSLELFFLRLFGGSTHKTYYQIDSEYIFMEGVQAVVLESVIAVTEQKGLRKLQPSELIPKRA